MGYKYVRIKGLYFCLQQNPAALAALLYLKGKPFGFRASGMGALASLRKIVFLVRELLYYQLLLRTNPVLLDLPVHGNLCFKVHNGYKVFNLLKGVVTKVFSSEISSKVVRQGIERARDAGRLAFAPSVLRWHVEDGWFEEEYVNGYHADGSGWTGFLRAFEDHLLPLVEAMISTSTPWVVQLSAYSRERVNILCGEKNRLSNRQLEPSKVDQIRNFADGMIKQLSTLGERSIHLVFSHGDFSPKHVLIADHSQMVIDWETFGKRSVLFDLYNAFFQQLWLGHDVPGISREMERAILSLESRLASSAPAIANDLLPLFSSVHVYRWLYYVERISRILESHEASRAIVDNILRWIQAFNRYEKTVAHGSSQDARCYQA